MKKSSCQEAMQLEGRGVFVRKVVAMDQVVGRATFLTIIHLNLGLEVEVWEGTPYRFRLYTDLVGGGSKLLVKCRTINQLVRGLYKAVGLRFSGPGRAA